MERMTVQERLAALRTLMKENMDAYLVPANT